MGRTGKRISRGLIGVLIVTVILGAVFYLHNLTGTSANEAPRSPLATVSTPAAAPIRTPATQPARAFAQAAPVLAPLLDAQKKRDAGDPLAARKLLNDALRGGSMSPRDIQKAKDLIAEINQTVIFSPKRFADDEFGGTYTVQSGDLLRKIADKYEVTWELLARLNGLSDPRKLRAGQTIKVLRGPFHAVVTRSTFTIDVYLGPPGENGSMYITSYPVGLGKDDATPSGTWLVETHKKIKNPTYYSPRGEGVIHADDPKNPLGERWIGLTGIDGHALGKTSYGIHGTIDEASIGRQESMGCIRLKNTDVEWLFDLLVEGKSMVIVKE